MIVTMNSRTFFRQFIEHESDELILNADYIIASNRIRIGKLVADQSVILFYPNSEVIIQLDDEKSLKNGKNERYVDAYINQLDASRLMLAHLIKDSILENANVVILSTSQEDKVFHHLKMIREYAYENFSYIIPNYKKGSKMKDFKKLNEPYLADILDVCDLVIKMEEKEKEKRRCATVNGKHQFIRELSKKQLKKRLKKEGLYNDTMSKEEMRETLEALT